MASVEEEESKHDGSFADEFDDEFEEEIDPDQNENNDQPNPDPEEESDRKQFPNPETIQTDLPIEQKTGPAPEDNPKPENSQVKKLGQQPSKEVSQSKKSPISHKKLEKAYNPVRNQVKSSIPAKRQNLHEVNVKYQKTVNQQLKKPVITNKNLGKSKDEPVDLLQNTELIDKGTKKGFKVNIERSDVRRGLRQNRIQELKGKSGSYSKSRSISRVNSENSPSKLKNINFDHGFSQRTRQAKTLNKNNKYNNKTYNPDDSQYTENTNLNQTQIPQISKYRKFAYLTNDQFKPDFSLEQYSQNGYIDTMAEGDKTFIKLNQTKQKCKLISNETVEYLYLHQKDYKRRMLDLKGKEAQKFKEKVAGLRFPASLRRNMDSNSNLDSDYNSRTVNSSKQSKSTRGDGSHSVYNKRQKVISKLGVNDNIDQNQKTHIKDAPASPSKNRNYETIKNKVPNGVMEKKELMKQMKKGVSSTSRIGPDDKFEEHRNFFLLRKRKF